VPTVVTVVGRVVSVREARIIVDAWSFRASFAR
jgi:hypothetical protein